MRNPRIKYASEIAKALGITRWHLWRVVNGYRESKRTLAAYHNMVKIIEQTQPRKKYDARNTQSKTAVGCPPPPQPNRASICDAPAKSGSASHPGHPGPGQPASQPGPGQFQTRLT